MDLKRLAIATLVGGITLLVAGQLVWGVALAGFFAANAGSASGVARDSSVFWALALGNLALGALLTLVLTCARAASIAQGVKIAAIVGLVVWLGVDFILYASTNASNLTATIVDPLLEGVHNGIAGAVIVAVIGKTVPTSAATG